MTDEDRMKFETDDFYIKSPEEMSEYFANIPEAIENTVEIANDDLKYCCFVKIPENGVDSYTEVCDNMIYLFQTLANKDTINIVHYLGSCYRNRMQSLEYISKQVDIPVKRVKKIMDNLDRLGIVWRVSADITDTPTIIYGYGHNTPLTCLLVIAKSISRYIRTHDLFIDAYSRGPFRSKTAEKTAPVPQADLWDNNNSIISEEE